MEHGNFADREPDPLRDEQQLDVSGDAVERLSRGDGLRRRTPPSLEAGEGIARSQTEQHASDGVERTVTEVLAVVRVDVLRAQ
jgi:hypothetical protein